MIGEQRANKGGGGRDDAKAVGRHANSGGSSLWGSGCGMSSTMVKLGRGGGSLDEEIPVLL